MKNAFRDHTCTKYYDGGKLKRFEESEAYQGSIQCP